MRRPLAPERAALLVVDMQEYFRAVAQPILQGVAGLIGSCRQAGVPVVYTQHGHHDPDVDGGMLHEWWADSIIEGTPAWRLMKETAPLPGERVYRKRRYSAFHGTGLESWLRARGIEDLLICGVMTNLCCETSARDAFVRDFRVFFLEDGTATVSAAFQRATLANLSFGFATLLRCAEAGGLVVGELG